MVVIVVAFVLVSVAAVVLLTEASRSLVPPIGPAAQPILTHAATPAPQPATARVLPMQRSAADVNVVAPYALEA